MSRRIVRSALCAGLGLLMLVGVAPSASALPASYRFRGPVFGLAARGSTLFVADAGAGIHKLTSDKGRLVVKLPGVTDVAPLKKGRMWALTSAPKDKNLYFINKKHRVRLVADIGRFEKRKNPDGGEVDSNPFDLQALGGGQVLIADAAGNDLLVAGKKGNVDWIATLPSQDVSTQNVKDLVGCPDPGDPDAQQICDLPDTMAAQAVSTGVAIGPDGAYYVTELKGFPAPRNRSRVWRIDPDVRHVECRGSITTNGCTVAARNLTSIVDIDFDSTGNAYVVELDEASWFAVEEVPSKMEGGTVDQCDTTVSPWDCTKFQGNLVEPMAVALDKADNAYAVIKALKRRAEVVQVPLA